MDWKACVLTIMSSFTLLLRGASAAKPSETQYYFVNPYNYDFVLQTSQCSPDVQLLIVVHTSTKVSMSLNLVSMSLNLVSMSLNLVSIYFTKPSIYTLVSSCGLEVRVGLSNRRPKDRMCPPPYIYVAPKGIKLKLFFTVYMN